MPSPTPPAAHGEFSLRRIAVPAFGPQAVQSVGTGAIVPVLTLTARDLGASVSIAALLVSVAAVTELASALPAGSLVARLGERRALVVAALFDVVALATVVLLPSLVVLFAVMALTGPSSAVFLLARQSYLTARAPVHLRARAMSTLGGVSRVGLFVGPFVGAPVVQAWGPRAAFGVAAAASLLAALIAWRAMDLVAHTPEQARAERDVRTLAVVRAHRRVLLRVGVGVLAISGTRVGRVVLIPLWAEHVGLSPAQTSLVFGVAGAVDMLLFYPAGSAMDRFGRAWVAVPCVTMLGLGLLGLPLTSGIVGVGTVAVFMALGNGLGSGIVMTLGADAAPNVGRAQFLGAWRLMSLVGANGTPLLVSALVGVGSLALASVVVGALAVLGGVWLLRWLPEYEPRMRELDP